jgi:hypothetical protein
VIVRVVLSMASILARAASRGAAAASAAAAAASSPRFGSCGGGGAGARHLLLRGPLAAAAASSPRSAGAAGLSSSSSHPKPNSDDGNTSWGSDSDFDDIYDIPDDENGQERGNPIPSLRRTSSLFDLSASPVKYTQQ